MTGAPTLPASIEIYDAERKQGWVDPELDFEYIDRVAEDTAVILSRMIRASAEICYQPGDGTRYPLVIMPLQNLYATNPRVVDGASWGRHAVSGIHNRDIGKAVNDDLDGEDHYGEEGFLISWVEHSCYPVRLRRRVPDLAADYVAEHWKTSTTSACSLAILFRAIAFHIDRLEAS